MVRTGTNTPRALIYAMVAVVFIGLGIAYLYYNGINRTVDPRIREARVLYEKYNTFAQSEQYDSVFWLMDTIESIYASVAHYRNGYETGVLYNNRAAACLSLFLDPDKIGPVQDSTLYLQRAEEMVRRSIAIYDRWLATYTGKDEPAIYRIAGEDFGKGLEAYDPGQQAAFLDRRVKEIIEARKENPRRLSVSYTNLGTIKRHRQSYDSAAAYYMKAIELWDQNLTAENNLNILLNRPLKKRNLIQKMFPPEK
jgi:tetratricopeptide (TPR) repeat protein